MLAYTKSYCQIKQTKNLAGLPYRHALLGFWAGVAPAGAGNSGSVDKYSAQVMRWRMSTCLGREGLRGRVG